MKLGGKEQHKAERQEKTNDQCCKGQRFIFRNLFFRNALPLELIGEEDWDSLVKYRHVNKEKK